MPAVCLPATCSFLSFSSGCLEMRLSTKTSRAESHSVSPKTEPANHPLGRLLMTVYTVALVCPSVRSYSLLVSLFCVLQVLRMHRCACLLVPPGALLPLQFILRLAQCRSHLLPRLHAATVARGTLAPACHSLFSSIFFVCRSILGSDRRCIRCFASLGASSSLILLPYFTPTPPSNPPARATDIGCPWLDFTF